MKSTSTFAYSWVLSAIALIGLPLTVRPAEAQNPGNNAVYNSSNGVTFSLSFIDASVFIGNGNNQSSNICGAIYGILSGAFYNYPATGAVIDARGIGGSTALTCPTGRTPWNNGTTTVNVPSTILLPAGTIIIPGTWVLPNYTRLIGAGDALDYLSTGTGTVSVGTTLQACKSSINGCSFNPNETDMIDLGTPPLCAPECNSVSVENLTLDGLGQSLNGIVNANAQTGSHVDHVSLFQLLGTGLSLSGNASNSGPYSNITFDTGGYSGVPSTVCASINGLNGTRGIHGLTCISQTNDAQAAVLLDSSNNSLEDVRIVGFYDGIRVGANANAQSNVLVNIIGDTNPTGALGNAPIIVVHTTSVGHTVSDLSIMGANIAPGGSSQTITIQDDLTGAQLKDTSVGIYALGEKASGGYSRFTTSPNAVTWGVGVNAPNTGSGGCSPGSLYSNANPSPNSPALYVCSVATGNWLAVK